jgi:hypothetical protein
VSRLSYAYATVTLEDVLIILTHLN